MSIKKSTYSQFDENIKMKLRDEIEQYSNINFQISS